MRKCSLALAVPAVLKMAQRWGANPRPLLLLLLLLLLLVRLSELLVLQLLLPPPLLLLLLWLLVEMTSLSS